MERRINQYRFGITLKLEPTSYGFFVDNPTSLNTPHTLCVYVADFVLEEFPDAEFYFLNSYYIPQTVPIWYLRQIMKNYYALFDFVCGGELV